jgi:hypothetical protein
MVGFLFNKVFIIMKIIITEDQLHLINEEYRRDRWDAEYSDEYPKYKKLFIKMLKQDISSWGKAHESIYLMNENKEPLFVYREKSKTLYYDYSVDREMEDMIPAHIVSRHLKNAVYDYFKGLFPDVEIKEVSGANIG